MADIINIKSRQKTRTKKPSRKDALQKAFDRLSLRERRSDASREIATLCAKLEKYPDLGLFDKIFRDVQADRLTEVDLLAIYLYRRKYNLNVR